MKEINKLELALEGYKKVFNKFIEWREEYKRFYGKYPQKVIETEWT